MEGVLLDACLRCAVLPLRKADAYYRNTVHLL